MTNKGDKMSDYETHPSWGNIQISRVHSTPAATLYASPIKHPYYIQMRICTSSEKRDLCTTWRHPDKDLIDISLTEAQFVELITSLNIGGGVPCTLDYVNGKRIERAQQSREDRLIADEIKKTTNDITKIVDEFQKHLSNVYELLPKNKKKELELQFSILKNKIVDTLPFVLERAHETFVDIVVDAKANLMSFIHIDREHFTVTKDSMTGAELRNLPHPPIGADRDLFEVVPGGTDCKIGNDDVVEIKNGKRFFSAPAQINPGNPQG